MSPRAAMVAAIKKRFVKRFGYCTAEDVERSVFTGKTDPGGWAPKAAVVVHHERGVPSPLDECFTGTDLESLWVEIDREVSKRCRRELYHEPVNGAVTAYY